MVDQLSGCEADKVLDAPLRTIVGCLAEVLPKGPAQTALYCVAGLCILAAPVMYKYYLGVLAQGAQPEGSLERQDYDKLRASLAGDILAARLYGKWLTAFLDWIERFFGDVGMADRTLFPQAFGLKKPASLWTAPAFDRCLLLALIYPIATIFVIWAISGHVGPAEAALGLRNRPGWGRGLVAVAVGFQGFAFCRATQATEGVRWFFWFVIGCASTAPVNVFGGLSVGVVVFATVGIIAYGDEHDPRSQETWYKIDGNQLAKRKNFLRYCCDSTIIRNCDHYALIRLLSPHLRKSDHERITGAGPLQRCNSIAHGRSCGQDTVILRRMAGGLW
jgi:hypothetical protein